VIVSEADLLTVPEAAAMLKVSPVTVSRWLRQGRLPAFRLGPRAVRIRRADLESVFSPARGHHPAPAELAEPAAAAAGGAARLAVGPSWDASGPAGIAPAEPPRSPAGLGQQLAALAAAGALREQIMARRRGAPLPPLEVDRKRSKRS
jgi:excisionase family DNA binding protein